MSAIELTLRSGLCHFVILFVLSSTASALDELIELYTTTQAVAMGNATTAADVSGYLANYYNPAALAKALKRRWEVILFDLEGIGNFQSISRTASAQSLGLYRLIGKFQENAGKYNFLSFSAVPAVSTRGFSFSVLNNYRVIGVSDGTNLDADSVFDIAPSIGVARNFAGNIVKLGVASKFILRNQLKGVFAHTALQGDETVASLSKEGYGISTDVGLLITLPFRFIPTLGVTWKDVLNTHFVSARAINRRSQGAPEAIPQSFNAGVSFKPTLARRLKTTFAVDFRHIERVDLPLRKRIHVGVQIENEKSLYVWFGANQLYWTAGIALRLPGGNVEIGTYGQDIAGGSAIKEDRRIMSRYTISF